MLVKALSLPFLIDLEDNGIIMEFSFFHLTPFPLMLLFNISES